MNPSVVTLCAYDLSNGIAKALFMNSESPIEAIWHSSIEINGTEYFFQNRITKSKLGKSPFGMPIRKEILGKTHLTEESIEMVLNDLQGEYNDSTYDIMQKNCNHFADRFAKIICGKGIPEDILQLPEKILKNEFVRLFLNK